MVDSEFFLGCIPKDKYNKFLIRFKKALKEGKKTGEKKPFEIEIKHSVPDKKGISIEFFSFDKTRFNEFIDLYHSYLAEAEIVYSINLEARDEKFIPELKEYYEKIYNGKIPTLLKIFPIPKEILKDFEEFNIHFRNKGKNFSIDFIPKNREFIRPLLDFGIDICEYHNIDFILKTNLDMNQIASDKFDPNGFLFDLLSILIYFNSSGKNIRYLTNAFKEGLKEVKLRNKFIQKRFDELIAFLDILNSFHGSKIKFKYDPKPIFDLFNKKYDESDIINFKNNLFNLVEFYLKFYLEISEDLNKIGELVSIDFLNLSISVPKFKNGFCLSFNFPGANNALDFFKK